MQRRQSVLWFPSFGAALNSITHRADEVLELELEKGVEGLGLDLEEGGEDRLELEEGGEDALEKFSKPSPFDDLAACCWI